MFLCQTFYSSETLSTTIHTFSVPYKIPQNKVRIKTNREFYRYYFSFETQFDLPISFLGYGLSLGDGTSLVFLKFDFNEEIQMKIDLHIKLSGLVSLGSLEPTILRENMILSSNVSKRYWLNGKFHRHSVQLRERSLMK